MTTTEADGGTGVLAGEERLLIDGELAGAAGGHGPVPPSGTGPETPSGAAW